MVDTSDMTTQELSVWEDLGTRTTTTTVFVVEDDEAVRRGLVELLSRADGIAVAGSAGSAREALPLVAGTSPDLVLLDARLPGSTGIGACRELRSEHPALRCLLLTSFDDEEALVATALAGAVGRVVKRIGGTSMVDAVRRLATELVVVDPAARAALVERARAGSGAGRPALLGEQEREVLELVVAGRTDAQIAARLGLTTAAVRGRVLALFAALGPRRRPSVLGLGERPARAGDAVGAG